MFVSGWVLTTSDATTKPGRVMRWLCSGGRGVPLNLRNEAHRVRLECVVCAGVKSPKIQRQILRLHQWPLQLYHRGSHWKWMWNAEIRLTDQSTDSCGRVTTWHELSVTHSSICFSTRLLFVSHSLPTASTQPVWYSTRYKPTVFSRLLCTKIIFFFFFVFRVF